MQLKETSVVLSCLPAVLRTGRLSLNEWPPLMGPFWKPSSVLAACCLDRPPGELEAAWSQARACWEAGGAQAGAWAPRDEPSPRSPPSWGPRGSSRAQIFFSFHLILSGSTGPAQRMKSCRGPSEALSGSCWPVHYLSTCHI